jgi:hypothetical protein
MVALWAKFAKYRCLVIKNWGPGEIFEVPYTFRVQFHLQNLKLQTPTNKFSLFKQNRLNLEVWWFEIRAPVKFWGPQNIGGPIPPSNPQIANTHQQILIL